MVAHLWELRADPAPLEAGARQWARVAAALTATADDIVDAARHALDQGWESEAAESYEAHRRQMVQHLDTFTTVAASIGGSLAALASMLRTAQEELDRSWATVATVPHELVGPDRVLLLHPSTDEDDGLVRAATATARAVRARLDTQLDAESARLRDARTELATARSGLVQAAGGAWPTGEDLPDETGLPGEPGPGSTTWGDPPSHAGTTSVAGSAAGGGAVPGLAPVGPIAVSSPALSGLSSLSASALVAAAAAGGLAGRRARRRQQPAAGSGMAPMGGMAAGAAMRGGSAGRPGPGPGAGGRAVGGSRSGAPRAPRQESAEETAARLAREKEEAREAKRALIAERRAERAARRAEREGAGGDGRPGPEVSEGAPGDGPPAAR